MLSWAPRLDPRAGEHLGLSPRKHDPRNLGETQGAGQGPRGWGKRERNQVLLLNPSAGGSTHLFLGQQTMKAALGSRDC